MTRSQRSQLWQRRAGVTVGSLAAVLVGVANVLPASAHHVVSTTPSPATAPVGSALKDSAILGATTPDRTVEFDLWAPGSGCSGTPLFTERDHPTAAQGAGTTPLVTTGSYTATTTGVYQWTAKILNGTTTEFGPTKCGDEAVTVVKAVPAISTIPSAGGAIGTGVTDSAVVTGGFHPGGTVTFDLYPPADATCANPADIVASHVANLVDGAANSGAPYTTAAVGTYNWVVTYSGDADNSGVISGCGRETVTTTKAAPVIATTPSPGGPVGTAISDAATVSGGHSPSGSVVFSLFPPSDLGCTGTPVAVHTAPLVDGQATSGAPVTTTAVGTYNWTAVYSGDAANAAATSGCGAEVATTTKAAPAITTSPSAGGPIGTAISDSATVSGGHAPTGTVTFTLYPPTDATCANPGSAVATHVANLVNGAATSGQPVTTTMVGTYNWVVSYSGDADNAGAVSGCGAETAVITKATPSIATTPSAGGVVGTQVTDTATVSGGHMPTGTVTFALYAPGNTACTGTPLSSGTAALVNGSATSPAVSTTEPGTYNWVATYDGDAANAGAVSPCLSEQVTITPPPPTIVTGVQGITTTAPGTPAAISSTPQTGADVHLQRGVGLIVLGFGLLGLYIGLEATLRRSGRPVG